MTDMTRREAMATMAAAAVSGVQTQAPLPPGRATLLEVPTKRTLTMDDLEFAGYVRFPPDLDDLWYSYGQLAVQRTGGRLRVFSAGNATHFFPVLEYIMPEGALSKDMMTAQMMTPVKYWGTVPDSARTKTLMSWIQAREAETAARYALDHPDDRGRITGGTGGSTLGGFLWDENRKGLWATYKDWYAPVEHHPTQLFFHLPDGGPMKIYGPWRTEWNSQMTGGGLTAIPQSFVDANLGGGSNVAVTCYSGGAASPFGAVLSRMRLLDPFTTPPDVSVPVTVTQYPHWTVANDGLIRHDINTRMKRDTRYKICGWNNIVYDCSAPGVPTPEVGPPLFGGKLANDQDTMSSALWIDLPDKHGLLFFGQLATTPEGYAAPGDPDGLTHVWYGAALSTANPKGKERYCCHSQYDMHWDATGPGCHYRVAKGWVYNPSDLVATARKEASLDSRVPASEFEFGKVLPAAAGPPSVGAENYGRITEAMSRPVQPGFWGGSAFDPTSRRIFVILAASDRSYAGPARPLIAAFDVK